MAFTEEEVLKQLKETFKVEAKEHLQALERLLMYLEKNSPAENRPFFEEIFREAHSLKGAARAVNEEFVEKVAHALENVFAAAKEGKVELTTSDFDQLYEAVDVLILQVEGGGQEGQAQQLDLVLNKLAAIVEQKKAPLVKEKNPVSLKTKKVQPSESGSNEQTTIRVATEKLNSLMTHIEELVVVKIRADQRLTELKKAKDSLIQWHKQWLKVRGLYDHWHKQLVENKELLPLFDFLATNQRYLKSLWQQFNKVLTESANDNMRLAVVSDDLQTDIRQLRMLPVANLFSGFYRMGRDLGKEQGKEVELYIEGEQTELDKKIIEEVKDPLTHILRNAIDHGLETPSAREKAGKNRYGSIWLRASQQGNSIVIEVEDDGQGINTEKLKEKAVAAGLLDASEAELLTEEEALYLVFRSGLSTATKVSKVSGRGVGLDVVKANVEKLNGVVKVSSRLGEGCKFTLILPLTLTTSRVLLAGSGSYKYAIPVQSIERIVRITAKEVFSLQGQKVIKINNRNIPLFGLNEVLEQKSNSQKEEHRLTALVVASADKRAALTVDGLYGETEVVVKPLGAHLKRVKNVAGATVLGDGQVVIVLNVSDLVKTASLKKQEQPSLLNKEAKKTILIVDDSLTTRILEKNILEAAGYHTILAADGREAWEILTSRSCDLVFTDLDMPVMDGYVLTSKIKQHPKLKNLPVVIVTALEDERARRKGLEVGADAYFVKQNFNREVILETVSQLV